MEDRTLLAGTHDFGDAPDAGSGTQPGDYNTLASDNGPSHKITAGLFLGGSVDGETEGLRSALANGDDTDQASPDDEDGLNNPAVDLNITNGSTPTVSVIATNNTGSSATITAWIDYNADGAFDNATERATAAVPTGTTAGTFTLTFPTVPDTSPTGTTFSRFRFSTDAAAMNPTGVANDGEVEDHAVTIHAPASGFAGGSQKINDSAGGFGATLDISDFFGSAVAGLGDLDGDGVEDVAVGARGDDDGAANSGAVWILFLNANGTVKSQQKISNTAGGLTVGPGLQEKFGKAIASIGDLDGDGVNDIAVGAPDHGTGLQPRGAVWVLFLNGNGTVKSHQQIARGVGGFSAGTLDLFDQFGASITSIGDIDGDGVNDLAVGAPGDDDGGTHSQRGAVWILLMNSNGTVKSEQKISDTQGNFAGVLDDSDGFGGALASLGDLDGDHNTELAVGASADGDGGSARGAVWVLSLKPDGTVASHSKISDTSGGFAGTLDDLDAFGNDIISPGDLNGDGTADLVVAAVGDDDGGAARGAVWVLYLDANGDVLGEHKISDTSGNFSGPLSDGDGFGSSVASIGDLNGDGFPDLVVGATGVDNHNSNEGAIWTVNLSTVDFGDAPDPSLGTAQANYRTAQSDNGPYHHIVSGLFLGNSVDGDQIRPQNAAANTDDTEGVNPGDEDGVLSPIDLLGTEFTQPTVTLQATNRTGSAATLYGWIDYDQNGDFELTTERTLITVPAGTTDGRFTLTFPVIPEGSAGSTYARFRLSTDAAAAHSFGPASDGEVEDYVFRITAPSNGTVDSFVRVAHRENGGPTLDHGDNFGASATSLGDLDGDGVPDLAVGATGDGTGGDSRGAVYIQFMNSDGTVKNFTKIASGLNGGPVLADNDSFGSSLASLGDLDGDGVTDLAVGARLDDTGGSARGAIYVQFMNSNGTVKSFMKIASGLNGGPVLADSDFFGISIASPGDLDGDGVSDLVVGASGDDTGGDRRGALHVLFMDTDGSVKNSTKIANGLSGGPTLADRDEFGKSMTTLGDLNNDGVPELAVGASGDDSMGPNTGAVHILWMNTDGTVQSTQKIANQTNGGPILATNDNFGKSVAAPGDLNGDSIPDLIVGANEGLIYASIYVLFMNADGSVKQNTKIAREINGGPGLLILDSFGASIAAVGDLNGDGIMDLAVGAPDHYTAPDNSGAVYTLFLNGQAEDELGLLTKVGRVPGNVVAVEQGTGLALVPDGNDNGVFVFTDTNGDIVIRGLAGTTVNGAAQAVLFPGSGAVTGTFRVLASTGTMLTAINDLTTAGLEVFGGAESEALETTNVAITANLTVNLTDGRNSYLFGDGTSVVAKSVVQAGIGNDIMDFRSANFGTINNVDTGSGNDTVTIRQTAFAGSLALTTADGSDTVIGDVLNAGGSMRVNTGNNNDNIDLNQWTAASHGIVEPGDGTDTANVSDSDLNGLFFANLGTGSNTFTSRNSQYQTSVNINTLPGNHNIDFRFDDIFGATFINAFNGTSDVSIDRLTASSIFVVRTAGSGDTVDITYSNFEDTLNISTNEGNDRVTVSDVQVDKQFFLDTSLGRDTVSLTSTTVLQDLLVNTGNANDTVTLGLVDVTQLTNLDAGLGIDAVSLSDSTFGTLTNINTGTGNDTLNVNGIDFDGNASLNTGNGDDTVNGFDVKSNAPLTIDTGANNDVIDLASFSPGQPLTIQPGGGNDAVRLADFQSAAIINIAPVSGNNVIDLQDNTFGDHVTIATANAHLAVRHRSNSFTTASFIATTTHSDDVWLDNGTSTFSASPAVFNFDDTTNTHIDALFSNLLGLLFP